MIARHQTAAVSQTNHGLVGHEDILHQFFFGSIATTTVAEIVLGTGTNTHREVALLETTHKGHTHGCREVGILAIRLLQAIETGIATHIDHR